jgi:hypothetical protein
MSGVKNESFIPFERQKRVTINYVTFPSGIEENS